MGRRILKNVLSILGTLFVSFLFLVSSALADNISDQKTFFVNSRYDEFSRTIIGATLRNISDKAYFYVDDRYWVGLNQLEKDLFITNMYELGGQFDDNIYTKETQFFGSESNPGIDNDSRITVLVEDLKRGNGGYFETGNLYSRKVVPESNEREMVAISAEAINSLGKVFLAHEFQHLISFNQKELKVGLSEDVWLNELRSEYAVTLVGYNDIFRDSSLEQRLDTFLSDSSDSLTEWPNVPLDYGYVSMFGEYLAEQFGPEIISETIKINKIGIDSINQYFQSKNIPDRFSSVFGTWLAANYLNNANFDKRLGYQKEGLQNFRVNPSQYILMFPNPYQLNSNLKPWEGSWHKFNLYYMPEGKSLKISFNSQNGFKLWYIDGLGEFGLLPNGGYIANKGGLNYVVLMPVNENKISGFTENDSSAVFSANIEFIDTPTKPILKNGDLIKRPKEAETYVIEGSYKRYLRPEIIALYGHLDPSKAIEADDETFNSYATANYVRNINEQKVYAVWPDGTKHWLHMTGDYFTQSGRDWNAIFIINDLELNNYKTGADITR